MARSSSVGALIVHAARAPVLGELVTRLRSFPIIKAMLRVGVADAANLPPR